MLAQHINVGIIGVSGYTGLELVKLILAHPIFKLSYIANTQGEIHLDEIHKMLFSLSHLPVCKAEDRKSTRLNSSHWS